jgi:predicted metal-dependent RNase
MVNTISMQDMRYLNLFRRITKIQTRFCFKYNEAIIFCVPQMLVSKAVGEDGKNVKQLSRILRKRIKVVASPRGMQEAKKFIGAVISPNTFKDLEIKGDELIITAGSQNKAALIGRNKRRFLEMQGIVKDFFKKDFKIV